MRTINIKRIGKYVAVFVSAYLFGIGLFTVMFGG